jgi:hypothetical protein
VLRKRASRLWGRRIRTRAWHQHLGFLFSIIALPSKRESRGRAISVPTIAKRKQSGKRLSSVGEQKLPPQPIPRVRGQLGLASYVLPTLWRNFAIRLGSSRVGTSNKDTGPSILKYDAVLPCYVASTSMDFSRTFSVALPKAQRSRNGALVPASDKWSHFLGTAV